jgi:hypothetical protein
MQDKLAYRTTYWGSVYFRKYKAQPSWCLWYRTGMVQCCNRVNQNNLTVHVGVGKTFHA